MFFVLDELTIFMWILDVPVNSQQFWAIISCHLLTFLGTVPQLRHHWIFIL